MERPPMSSGRQIILLILLIFSALYVVGPMLFIAIRPMLGDFDVEKLDWNDPTNAYLSAAVSGVAMLLTAFVLFIRMLRKKLRDEIVLSKWTAKGFLVMAGLLALGIFLTEGLYLLNHFLIEQFPQSGFLEQETEQAEHYRHWFNPLRTELYIPALILFALIPAIAEELVFRGLMLKKLNEVSSGNTHFAVVVSALLFAGFHMQPWNLLPMVAMGIIFGYVYVYLKDIRYTMLMHFLFNGLQITTAFFFADQVPQ